MTRVTNISLVRTDIFIAKAGLGTRLVCLNHFGCVSLSAVMAIRSSISLPARERVLSLFTRSFARLFMARSRIRNGVCGTKTAINKTICPITWRGDRMPRMRQISGGTELLLWENARGSLNLATRAFGSFVPRYHSGCGIRLMLQRFLASRNLTSAMSPTDVDGVTLVSWVIDFCRVGSPKSDTASFSLKESEVAPPSSSQAENKDSPDLD